MSDPHDDPNDGARGTADGTADLAPARDAILDRAIDLAAFEGWSLDVLRRAAVEAGYDRAVQRRAFPRGVADLVDYLALRDDEAMAARLAEMDLETMRIRDKITWAVRARIEAMAPHKEAAYRASQFLASPVHASEAARHIARTCDRIWRTIGDTSTDFNFYTKRATLSAVYGATVLAWFSDETPDSAETWAFLDRRIEGVMSFEKTKARVRGAMEKLPSPLAVLATLRYPGGRTR